MRLYDTLSRRKREFRPLAQPKPGTRNRKPSVVRMYTCGPSVYAYSHIGNFRTYLFEDVLVRYLIYNGYSVRRVMNITDVEDKAIEAARRQNMTPAQEQRDKIRAFFSEWDALGMLRPAIVAKASAHVPQMLSLIKKICAHGYCKRENGGLYFNVRKFKSYGKLRRLRSRRYLGVMREDDYWKEGLWDFRLWKRWTPSDGRTRWGSPYGDGRPGWHIECSAISTHYLGERFDIHTGGTDNIFPHHENEIAQSFAANGKGPANFWLHCRHLTIGKRKMSKRTGNVLYVTELVEEGVHPKCLRFCLISKRYRSRLDFTKRKLGSQSAQLRKAWKTISLLRKLACVRKTGEGKTGKLLASHLVRDFESAMDDDVNTGLAFKGTFEVLGRARSLMEKGKLTPLDAKILLAGIGKIDSVLRVLSPGSSEPC